MPYWRLIGDLSYPDSPLHYQSDCCYPTACHCASLPSAGSTSAFPDGVSALPCSSKRSACLRRPAHIWVESKSHTLSCFWTAPLLRHCHSHGTFALKFPPSFLRFRRPHVRKPLNLCLAQKTSRFSLHPIDFAQRYFQITVDIAEASPLSWFSTLHNCFFCHVENCDHNNRTFLSSLTQDLVFVKLHRKFGDSNDFKYNLSTLCPIKKPFLDHSSVALHHKGVLTFSSSHRHVLYL